MWVSMCFPRAVDSYFIVKKRPYSLAKIATRGCSTGGSGLPATTQHCVSVWVAPRRARVQGCNANGGSTSTRESEWLRDE